MMDLQKLMDLAVAVSHQAAEQIMTIYQQDDFNVRLKSDDSPVTQADILAHHLISEKLQQGSDNIPVLSEESTEIGWHERQNWHTYWLIDPLDGTKEFVDRNGEFTINIALIHNGEAVMGVVAAPALKEVYMAAKGIGAFKKSDNQPTIPIHVRSVPLVDGHHKFTVVIGRRTYSKSVDNLYSRLASYEKVALGSALKICRIAEGQADLYPRFGKISEWDTAAAQCVLECAGGQLTDMQLSPIRYNTKDSLLNPDFIAFGDRKIIETIKL